MYILKKLRFLENRNCFIINNISKATKAYIEYDKDYFVEATQINSQQFSNMYELTKNIIELGIKLYSYNKSNLQKIKDNYNSRSNATNFLNKFECEVSCSIQDFKYDYLLFKRDTIITKETANAIKEWCDRDLPISFISTTYKGEFKNKVDMHSLIDVSIFMYLLFSAICNENIKKIDDYAKRKKLEKFDNGIRFSDIVANYIDEDHFYARVISYINFYENNLLDLSRPIFKEDTKLYLKQERDDTGRVIDSKPTLKRCFENIYGFYLFVIKMAIYSAGNGFQIVNMCPCGEVIDGKSDLCKSCNKMNDTRRKQNK